MSGDLQGGRAGAADEGLDAPIYDPHRSVVIVAGAGTGKTYRLVRRYLRIVASHDPSTGQPFADPEEVIAVTFTRAAAAELRQRVFDALAADSSTIGDHDAVLSEVVRCTDAGRAAHLCRTLGGAPIGTLHSLCARLLRQFPELCGVPPDARPIEPHEDAARLDAFVGEFLGRALDGEDPALKACCHALLREHPLDVLRSELRAMVSDHADIPVSWTRPEGLNEARNAWMRAQWTAIFQSVAPSLEALRDAIDGVEGAKASLRTTLGKYRARLEPALALMEDFHLDAAGEAWAALARKWMPTKSCPDAVEAAKLALNRAIATARTRRHKNVDPPKNPGGPEHLESLARFVTLARAIRLDYAGLLLEEGLLRYDDLERLTLELLEHPVARAFLAGRFKHVLVDEFQDTNGIQVAIVDALVRACGDAKIFYVGDPKQSIYRFRGAEVDVFEAQVERYREEGRVIPLTGTRRSSPALAAMFNAFFPALFGSEHLGPDQIPHVDDDAHVPWEPIEPLREGADIEGAPVDLLFRTRGGPVALQDEGTRIARHLGAMHERCTYRGKPLRWSDVAVLVPRWRFGEAVRAALDAHGIPAQLGGGRGLLALPEVRDLINLVRRFADRGDDYAAAAVLRGPVFACSDLGLYALARWDGVEREGRPWGEGPFPMRRARRFATLVERATWDPHTALASMDAAGVVDASKREELSQQLSADAASFVEHRETLARLVAAAGAENTADLLAEAIVTFRLEAHWLTSPRGPRAVANAWKFVELVRALEARGPDLASVVRWLDGDAEPAPEGLLAGDTDAVTITTYHGSKGKEWPVVVVAGLGDDRRASDRTSWQSDAVPTIGYTEKLPVPRMRTAHDGFQSARDPLADRCAHLSRPLDAAEQKRLLYVTMTRARDRLVLSGHFTHAHLGGKDKPIVKKLLDETEFEDLEGEPRPLFLCTGAGEMTLARLGLALPYRDDESPHLLRLPDESPFSDSIRTVTDEMLCEATAQNPEEQPRAGAERNTQLEAWRPEGRIDTLRPSAGHSPWSTDAQTWTLPTPSRKPILYDAHHDPRTLGTLFHAAMELWNFEGDAPSAQRCLELARVPFPDDAAGVGKALSSWVDMIADHELATELRTASARGDLFHEVPVDAIVDGHRVAGRIDLLWRGAAGWNLLDYKVTKKVRSVEELEGLEREYGPQLELYRRALSRWRPRGELLFWERFGLWLAPLGQPMWLDV